jgi:type 1 glutamine amidotransferase
VLAAALPAQEKKLLFLTHSAGYVHDVVKRPAPGQLSLAEVELTAILKPRGFAVECTQDCAVLDAANLRKYDVVVFYTTGELPAPRGGAQALLEWVRAGGAFAGIHCASDTWYGVPAYGEMVGGVFDGHPWNQKVRIRNEGFATDPDCPLGDHFELADEIYQFKAFAREPLDVLLSLDVATVDLEKGKRVDEDYALAWFREYGNGRVFYTALGHGEGAWRDRMFREQLGQGIGWLAFKGTRDAWPQHGARVLLRGADPAVAPQFTHRDGTAVRWSVEGGTMTVVPKTGDLISKEKLGDFRLHLEFRVPVHPPADEGQARGNSGLYLQDRYEIQILDSYGLEAKADDCGAIYAKKPPLVNACRKPGAWQSYDVAFKAARFQEGGKKTANARATVWQNGLRIHDDVEIDGPTGGGEPESPDSRPIRLQDHGNLVSFRNVWVVPR